MQYEFGLWTLGLRLYFSLFLGPDHDNASDLYTIVVSDAEVTKQLPGRATGIFKANLTGELRFLSV